MIVFAFPPQAAQETAPYYLSGINYDTKTATGTLVVVPPGCTPPEGADAPVFCMDERDAGTLVGEQAAAQQPDAAVWISSRISGGALRARLLQALEQYGTRLWLRIEPLCMRFPMPCPTGEGETVLPEESARIQKDFPAFFSPELCCMYCAGISGENAAMHLFDTPQTISKKLQLANELGAAYVFGDIPLEAIQ